jgi:hypothetical protein
MRQIIFAKSFDEAAGYRLIDEALEIVTDGLRLNPYAFPKFESDWISFRYAVTRASGIAPPLIFVFQVLKNKDVELTHVEVFED